MATTSSQSDRIHSYNRNTRDSYKLHGSDHPGLMLVSSHLTKRNYLQWSKSMMIALTAKIKLEFIDGSITKPNEHEQNYDDWRKVDSIVTAWLLNSISTEIADAFLFTDSAQELWKELNDRFGECNGPLLYKIQREICSYSQGNQSVTIYYTVKKKLWDEITSVKPTKFCACGLKIVEGESDLLMKLIQFLRGLNGAFYQK